MIGLVIAAVGVALMTAGLVVVFGPWAAVVVGAALTASGVLVDWEAVHGKHPAPPPS